MEERGHGVPIAAFGDTLDKVVLHPGHLGYKFNYIWGAGKWYGECWDVGVKDEEKRKANEQLWDVAQVLVELGYEVWLVLPFGDMKGYLSTVITKSSDREKWEQVDEDINEFILEESFEESEKNELVLFVFGLDVKKLMSK